MGLQTSAVEPNVQRIDLIDSLTTEWIKLPLAAMLDVGPASQTLGGLLKISNRETFVASAAIASRARLPLPTVRKHLDILERAGWISNRGRLPTRGGRARRTCTISISDKALTAAKTDYGVLPWWACLCPRNGKRLPWSARAVLSIVMARLMALKAAAEKVDAGMSAVLWDTIANWGGSDHFRFPLASLESRSGLSREAIITAKRRLYGSRIVTWCAGKKKPDGTIGAQYLIPNGAFRIHITAASPGKCYIDWTAK